MPPDGQNYTFCADPQIGDYQKIARTSYERALRRAALFKLQQREYEIVPRHTIIWRANIDAMNDDLKNFKPVFSVSDFWNAYEWEI